MQKQTEIGQLCVKFKREKMTHFLLCKPFDPIESLKRRVAIFYKDKNLQSSDIRFYVGQRLVDDKSNIHDQGIQNNSLVYFKLRKGNTNEWEQFTELGI